MVFNDTSLCSLETRKTKHSSKFNRQKKVQRRLEASKWICPYCKEVTDRFYKKLHYRCLPEDKKRELENEEESKFETCIYCDKLLNPYYKNFHYCQAMSEQQKVVSIQQKIPNRRKVRKRLDNSSYAHDLSEYLKHKAVLEEEYWILYIDDKRIGPVEKATPEELTSWDPNEEKKKEILNNVLNYQSQIY